MICELCGRDVDSCNEHHFIPKINHSNKWFKKRYSKEELLKTITICENDCHKEIHRLIPNEKTLGKDFNTIEKLRNHDKLKVYIEWIKNK